MYPVIEILRVPELLPSQLRLNRLSISNTIHKLFTKTFYIDEQI